MVRVKYQGPEHLLGTQAIKKKNGKNLGCKIDKKMFDFLLYLYYLYNRRQKVIYILYG